MTTALFVLAILFMVWLVVLFFAVEFEEEAVSILASVFMCAIGFVMSVCLIVQFASQV